MPITKLEKYTHQKKDFVHQTIQSIILSVLSFMFTYSFIVNLLDVNDNITLQLALLVGLFGLSIVVATYFSILSLFTKIEVNENGISLKRFHKVLVSILWEEIKEIGIGSANSIYGRREKIYFSKRELNEEEKNNLDFVQREVIYLFHPNKEWIDFIEKRCPIKLPNS